MTDRIAAGTIPMAEQPVRGVIFDLDGTLVDSGLDFHRIRQETGIGPGTPILEAIDKMDNERATACREILARHEDEGARRARPMPHLEEFLGALSVRKVRRAVLTRNRRSIAHRTLARLSWEFDPVLGREDAPIKPDPAAIHIICKHWGLEPTQVAMIGDYRFDIEAGHNAGVRTVLYTRGRDPDQLDWAERADFVLTCFSQHETLLAWLS